MPPECRTRDSVLTPVLTSHSLNVRLAGMFDTRCAYRDSRGLAENGLKPGARRVGSESRARY